MAKYYVRRGLLVLVVLALLWLIAHALGDNVGELLCELTFITGTAVILSALISLGIIWGSRERISPNFVLIAITVCVALLGPHFVVSAKLAPAKWAFKLAVAERTANPETVGQDKIEAALAMRDEILRRSSAFSTWSGWQYDRHTHFMNVGDTVYIWIPFSGFFRKPATTNGLGARPPGRF